MKTIIKLCLALFVIVLVAAGVSPYYRLYQLKQAYDAKQYETLVAAVDFETLRPNLKTQLYDKASNITQNLTKELSALGLDESRVQAFANKMIDSTVDDTITHENAMRLARGEYRLGEQVAGLVMLTGWGADGDVSSGDPNQDSPDAKDYQLGYCGLNCFFVKTDIKGKMIEARLSRQGWFDWKIDNIILP